MPSIFPSERPQWGWLIPCLTVADLSKTLAFYEGLGFARIGGDLEEGWAIIHNGPTELHLFSSAMWTGKSGDGTPDILNFRGGNVDGIRAALSEQGVSPTKEHAPTSFTCTDPDGRGVFFDIGEPEVTQLQTGQPLTTPLPDGIDVDHRALDLGNFTWCLSCEDLQATMRFYRSMGFATAGGDPEHDWVILARVDHTPEPGQRVSQMHLSLFSGMFTRDWDKSVCMLNFRGGNVSAIADTLGAHGIDLGDGVKRGEDGGESLLIEDPDDRPVFFDTTPAERLYLHSAP